MKEHYKSKLLYLFPEWVEAVTLGEHVHYRSDMPPQWLKLHEAVHVLQFKRYGLFVFFVLYVSGWIRNGFDYHKIPLEVEAYQVSAPKGYIHGGR